MLAVPAPARLVIESGRSQNGASRIRPDRRVLIGDRSDSRERRLRLVTAGRSLELRWGSVRVVAAPPGQPPFEVEAVAREEDTHLVLSAPAEARPSTEHPIRLMTALHEALPEQPGSVVVRTGHPLPLLAVVHDLDREPTWREDWVCQALAGVLQECEMRQLTSLGLPPLGCVHGRLPVERFVELLRHRVRQIEPERVRRIWLMLSPGQEKRLRAATL